MDYRNKMYRRLSIFFLLMALIALTVFVFILFFMAKENVFTCLDSQFFCYISPEYSFYRSAVYGLGFSMVLLILLSSIFSKQIEYIAEYSGYTKSVSATEREKIKEASSSSTALKEYFLHMQALEQEKLNNERQTTIEDFNEETNEEPIEEPNEDFNEKINEDPIENFNEETVEGYNEEPNEELIEDFNEELIVKIDEESTKSDFINISDNKIDIQENSTTQNKVVLEEFINLDEETIEEQQEDKDTNENNSVINIVGDKQESESLIIVEEEETLIPEIKDTKKEIKYRVVPRKTKKDLEKIIFEQSDLNKTKSKLFLKTVLAVMTEEISQGNVIDLKDFGKFRKQTYKSRNAINPKTKEKIIILEHSVARFYPNKTFSKYLTENNKIDSDLVAAKRTIKNIVNISKNTTKIETIKSDKSKTLTKINNKKEIISYIYDNTDLSKNKSKVFLNAFIEVIIKEIESGNLVKIPNIGKLTIVERAPKRAVNPHTKEEILIPKHKALKFKFSKDFKLIINQKK